jgi:CheY-like chemotaxis protein
MPKILVVDDEKNILELVRFNLEREGYEVLTSLDGARGLELARSENPDLIVLDVMLPEISGLEVCRELHLDPATKKIPIIMLYMPLMESLFLRRIQTFFTKVFLNPPAKNCRSDPQDVGAFFQGYFIVTAHAHGQAVHSGFQIVL